MKIVQTKSCRMHGQKRHVHCTKCTQYVHAHIQIDKILTLEGKEWTMVDGKRKNEQKQSKIPRYLWAVRAITNYEATINTNC